MPELPEVERVRSTLAPRLAGRRVTGVEIHRPDIVTGPGDPVSLLAGDAIEQTRRHGKQLALVGASGRCVCIHLGMTGSLRHHAGPTRPADPTDPHVHLVWQLDDGGRLEFRDPRRFGGVWTFASLDDLHATRWAALGEDALTITPARLHAQLARTRRSIKAALLDQGVVAGLGNIYVDELLFACRLPPQRPAEALTRTEVTRLVETMRRLLGRAITAGGSSFRDYVDGEGRRGGFQAQHRVYGRGGEPCVRCREVLRAGLIAGRTTVWCRVCQPAVGRRRKRVRAA